ncbi:hypothetical protein GCM10027034_26600 [Ramlibacter solisilvae]|uniref:Uncharacterized protein n=1 Tax=Ramlibacter tataouinensis TaxID=94132 RepID=A0A127JQY4_9BURK|nr:hypothetical protein [Ramlibacter tataouinensis]AMO22329.1 hypothetical protein UC35_04730 [Ramlibacter tataouinensis]
MAFATFDPSHDEDGRPIVLREPRQSWRANVFWALMLGLPAVGLPLLAGDEAMALEKYGTVLLGLGWMGFMGASAWRNLGRTVRCDMEWITLSQAFAPTRVALSQVASVTREDVRRQLRAFRDIGVSQAQRRHTFDTLPPIVMYVLRDAQGRTLMRLDQGMEPAGEMSRFLKRLQRQAGPVREG